MANRFFVDSDDDDVEEEEDGMTPHEEEQEIEAEMDEDFDFVEKKSPVHSSSEALALHIEKDNLKVAVQDFKNLQKALKLKSFTESNVPNFLIRSLGRSITLLPENTKDKRTNKLREDILAILKPYPNKLAAYKDSPDDFADDNDDEEIEDWGMDENENGSEDDGGWFDESDDEDANKIIENVVSSGGGRARRDISTAEALEARLEAEKNKVITEEDCLHELQSAKASRDKGKITITVQRLSDLLAATQNTETKRDLKLEICLTVSAANTDSAISLPDWSACLKVLPDLTDSAKVMVMLFERLDRDFWARSIDHHLFSPETSSLHSLLPDYLKILRLYADTLLKCGDEDLGATLQHLLLQYIYNDESIDAMPIALSVIKIASKPGTFPEDVANNFKIRASLFLAGNLATRKMPIAASEIIKAIPVLPQAQQLTQVLYNRMMAIIGISAFNLGLYRLSCATLRNLSKFESNVLGQSPNIYPPWLAIDTGMLETITFLSATILDLPYLCFTNPDETKIVVPIDLHRLLQRSPVIYRPEELIGKCALAIFNAKKGNWREAWKVIQTQFKDLMNPDQFLNHLKEVTLACFLLTASTYYDSVSVDFLAKKFELDPTRVVEIIKKLLKGEVPVTDAPIKFSAEFLTNDSLVSFEKVESESPLIELGNALSGRTANLSQQLN